MRKLFIKIVCILGVLQTGVTAFPPDEIYLQENPASPQAYLKIAQDLWGQKRNILMLNIAPQTHEEGETFAEALSSGGPIPALRGYDLSRSTLLGLQGFFSRFSQKNFMTLLVTQDTLSEGHIRVLAKETYIKNCLFYQCTLENPTLFVQNANLSFQLNPYESFIDDKFVEALIQKCQDPNTYQNLCLEYEGEGNTLTSPVIVKILEKARAVEQSEINLTVKQKVGLDDKIAVPLKNLLQEKDPENFNFRFSNLQGDTMRVLRAIIEGLFSERVLVDKTSTLELTHCNLQDFTEDDWSTLVQYFPILILGHNDLGSSLSTLKNPLSEVSNRKIFWWDLSFNDIGDSQAQDLFANLTSFVNRNPPKDAFYLAIGGNPWEDAGVQAFVNFLNVLASQSTPDSWNQISLDGSCLSLKNWEKIFNALKGVNLSSLSLNNCRFGADSDLNEIQFVSSSFHSLGALIKESPLLWFFTMMNSGIGDGEITALADGLKGSAHLPSYLYLSGNDIGDRGAYKLAEAMKTVQVPLQSNLYIQDSPKLTAEGAKALILMNQNRVVCSPYFGGIHFKASDILEAYKDLSGGVIGLERCHVTPGDAVTLAGILEKNPVFTGLVLNNNSIDDRGFEALGKALRKQETHGQTRETLSAILALWPRQEEWTQKREIFDRVKAWRTKAGETIQQSSSWGDMVRCQIQ